MRYGAPVTGGSIRLTHELVISNHVFQQTAAAKMLALELIKQLNEGDYNVCLQAYNNEYIILMAQYSNVQNSTGLDGETNDTNDNNDALWTALSKRYWYTILEHYVGYHHDKNTSFLKFNMCF